MYRLWGKTVSETSVRGNHRCRSCATKGKLNPSYKDSQTIVKCDFCYKEFYSYERHTKNRFCSKVCFNRWKIGRGLKRNNPNWRGGIANLPYSEEFNLKLKEKIRERDNYKCQICGVTEHKLIKKLSIHHIDYCKQNNKLNNLISLCSKCHGKTNWDRDYWYAYLRYKLDEN